MAGTAFLCGTILRPTPGLEGGATVPKGSAVDGGGSVSHPGAGSCLQPRHLWAGPQVQWHRLYLTQGCPFKVDLHFSYIFSGVIGRGTFVSSAKMPYGLGGNPTTCSLTGKPISPNGLFSQEN